MSSCIVSGIHTSGLRNREIGTEEPWRSDADHRQVRAADDELAADDGRIALKAAAPVPVAHHHHAAGADRRRVPRFEQPANLRTLPKGLEEAAGHELHGAPLGRIRAARQPHLHLRRRRRREQLRLVLQLPLRFLDAAATSSA